MRNRFPPLLAALAAMAFFAGEVHAQSPAGPGPDKAAVERIVRDYLLAHPEVVERALRILRAKREEKERVRVKALIEKRSAELLRHPMSPVSGNAAGDVTVVEFFDYQCGFCRRALPTMVKLLETDPGVRVVWKEFPILGPVSDFAARASMAAERQGKYHEFHVRLMGEKEKLSEERIVKVAAGVGLDVARLRRDMDDPAIRGYLDETGSLARALGIRGTPAFVIGGTVVPGFVDGARMRQLVAAERSGG